MQWFCNSSPGILHPVQVHTPAYALLALLSPPMASTLTQFSTSALASYRLVPGAVASRTEMVWSKVDAQVGRAAR